MANSKEFWAYVYFKVDKKYKVVPHTHIKYFSPKTETDFDKAREYQIRWREYDECDAKPSDASDTDDEDYWRGQILHLSYSRSHLMEWLSKNRGKRMLVHPVKTKLEDISRPGKSDMSDKLKNKECINAKKAALHESRKRNWNRAMETKAKDQERLDVGSAVDIAAETITRLKKKLSSAQLDLVKKNTEIEQLKEKNLESLMLIKALTRENLELRNVRYLGENDQQESLKTKISEGNAKRDLSQYWGESDSNCNSSKGNTASIKETATAGIVHSPTPLPEEPLLAASATPEPPEKVTEPHEGSNDVQQCPPFLQEVDGMIHVGYGVWITCKAWGVCKARPVLSKKGEDPEVKYCRNVCYAVVGDKMMERSITGNTAPKYRGISEPKKQLTPEKYKAIYGIMERAWSQDDNLKKLIPTHLKQVITKSFASKSCDMVKYRRKKLLKSSA